MIRSHCVVVLFLLTLIHPNTFGQTYADKSYYLIDSLVLDELSEYDREILDMCIEGYHQYDDDTIKIRALFYLSTEMLHPIRNKYLDLEYQLVIQKLKPNLEPKIKRFYQKILAQCINDQANNLSDHGHIEAAKNKYLESIELAYSISDKMSVSTGLNNLGQLYLDQGDIKTGRAYYLEALEIRKQLNDPERIATSLNNMGYVCNLTGDTKGALQYYFESLNLADSLNLLPDIAIAHNNIGIVYVSQKNYQKALKHHFKALEIRQNLRYTAGEANSLSNIAECYRLLKKHKDAEQNLLQALRLYEDLNQVDGMIRTSNGLAKTLVEQGLFDQALMHARFAFLKSKEIGYIIGSISAQTILSEAYRMNNNVDSALHFAIESVLLGKAHKIPRLERNAYLQLSECYKVLGDFDKGWEAYSNYVLLKDSLANNNIRNAALIQESDRLVKITDRALALKDKQNKALKAEQNEERQIFIWSLIGMLFLMSILGIWIWRRKRKSVRQSHDYKQTLSQQKQELEALKSSVESNNRANPILKSDPEFKMSDINQVIETPLSTRELAVLEKLVNGVSNQEIADKLFISINTVKSHLIRIYSKLNVNNRSQAIQKVKELELTLITGK